MVSGLHPINKFLNCCFVLNRKVVDSPKHLSYFTQNIPCNFTRTLWVFKV